MNTASGANGRRLSGWAAFCLAGLASVGVGCVEPQSGVHAASWCATGATSVVLDDFEDGDDVPCGTAVTHGRWTTAVDPDGSGAWGAPAASRPTDLSVADRAVRLDSYRAQHLSAALAPAGVAKLVVTFDAIDLSGYGEIDFFARSDGNSPKISVTVVAASGSAADEVQIATQWGEGGDPSKVNNVALFLLAGAGDPISAIEFRLPAPADGSGTAGLWIDDIHLKRK